MSSLLPFVVSGLANAGVYVLSGIGVVVLYRASGVINLSQGALGALAALIAWNIVESGGPSVFGWLLGLLLAAILSVGYGRFVAPRLAYADRMVQSIGTLAFALILMGAMNMLWGELPRRLRLPTDTTGIDLFGIHLTYTRILVFAVSIAVSLATYCFLRFTRVGLTMRAIANDRDLSGLLGVKVRRADTLAWLMSGLLAGLSGLIFADLTRFSAQSLTFLVIPAVAAALFGRLTSLPLTVLGGVLIGVVEAVLTIAPVVASFRSATAFIVATIAILWVARRPIHGLIVRP